MSRKFSRQKMSRIARTDVPQPGSVIVLYGHPQISIRIPDSNAALLRLPVADGRVILNDPMPNPDALWGLLQYIDAHTSGVDQSELYTWDTEWKRHFNLREKAKMLEILYTMGNPSMSAPYSLAMKLSSDIGSQISMTPLEIVGKLPSDPKYALRMVDANARKTGSCGCR